MSSKRPPKEERGYVNEAFSNIELELETVDLDDRGDEGDYHADGPEASVDKGSQRNGRKSTDSETVAYQNVQFGDTTVKTFSDEGRGGGEGAGAGAEAGAGAPCGLLWMRPACLQRFRTPKWALFWLCIAGALQGMVVNGFVNVVITTIERRFGLRSSQTGMIAGGYDLASFLCLVPVTYLGGRKGASKPRWLGWGVALMGAGGLMFALPHLLAPGYGVMADQRTACRRVENITTLQSSCEPVGGGSGVGAGGTWALMIFLAAQLLHGAGASPLFTLGVTYIDENVSTKMSSVYLGIFYTMSIIGPAIGFVVGGQLLKIYTDFLYVDPKELGLTPDSNVWIGAWWIGFLLSALLCFMIAIPLMAFPPSLPGSAEIQKQKISEAYDGDSSKAEAFSKIRELPKAFTALMKNPTFFFLNLAGATEGILLSGFAAFLPKLIENQFSITASSAAMLMGIVTVPAGGGGTFFGGYLVKKLKLQCAGIIKLCVWSTLIAVLFSTGFFISCPNLAFAGLNQPYGHNTPAAAKSISLDSACNQGCSCSRSVFDPVCGVDGVMYYSPCYAGCSKETSVDGSKAYKDCTCIKGSLSHTGDSILSMSLQDTTNLNETKISERKYSNKSQSAEYLRNNIAYEAINTMCESDCQYLWLFLFLIFVTMFFTFLSTMPALSATLRCVRDDQRSFALGIQWIKVRILGTIPSPLIFGVLIDESCILWQKSCDGKGACLVYNNRYMSRYMLALALLFKACSLLFFFSAWWFYKAPQHAKITPSINLVQNNDTKQNNHSHSNGHVNEGVSEHF